jgi:hypothetical protein
MQSEYSSRFDGLAIPITIVVVSINFLAYFINKWCLCGSIPLTIYILFAVMFEHINPVEIWNELNRGN